MTNKSKNILIIAGTVIGILLILLFASIKIIPTGYTGIVTTFGQISEDSLSQGIKFRVPFVQDVKKICNKQQDKTFEDEIWGETSEKTPVVASDITITYQISKEKSAWIYINVKDIKDLISDSIVASAVKSAMTEFTAENVTKRSKIENLAKSKLIESINEKYGESVITINKVVINQMDFEDSYNKAIAARSISVQEYEKQTIDNKKAIEKAEADKKVKIKNAEAEAEAKLIKAEAEAKANEKINKSMTEGILKSKFYDKWDGKLPDVMADGTVITKVGE